MAATKIKAYYCDNCGRLHVGYYETTRYRDGTETDFICTDWKGNERLCKGCGKARDMCTPKRCFNCDWIAQEAWKKKFEEGAHHELPTG